MFLFPSIVGNWGLERWLNSCVRVLFVHDCSAVLPDSISVEANASSGLCGHSHPHPTPQHPQARVYACTHTQIKNQNKSLKKFGFY